MLLSGSGGQGCPLATGPSGRESEPKAPGKAWREDARQTLGLSTGIANSAACMTGLRTLRLFTVTADIIPTPLLIPSQTSGKYLKCNHTDHCTNGAENGFHQRPGLQRLRFRGAGKTAKKPEAGIINVTHHN